MKEVSELLITDKKSLAKEQGGDCVNRPVLIVCGTGYIMPEARAFLGIIEPRYKYANAVKINHTHIPLTY